MAAPEDKGAVTHALSDSACLVLRSSNQCAPEIHLLNEANDTSPAHTPPRASVGVCPQGLAATSVLPVAVDLIPPAGGG